MYSKYNIDSQLSARMGIHCVWVMEMEMDLSTILIYAIDR